MEKKYKVTNRSNSHVIYNIPELNVRREFAPGESKQIGYDELEKLSYRSGGPQLLADYLKLEEIEVVDKLNMQVEREYHMDADAIINLLKNGSMDEFLDCLDFAPEGVIELIKDISVKLPLNDMNKANAITEKTGFNVLKAIENAKLDAEGKVAEAAPQRRVKEEVAAGPVRRTTDPAPASSSKKIIIPNKD